MTWSCPSCGWTHKNPVGIQFHVLHIHFAQKWPFWAGLMDNCIWCGHPYSEYISAHREQLALAFAKHLSQCGPYKLALVAGRTALPGVTHAKIT